MAAGLRQVPYLEASEALCSLPGVGPKVTMLPWPGLISALKAPCLLGLCWTAISLHTKLSEKHGLLDATVCLRVQVAACVCLFSLDKHAAIPVDTHVWQLAARYYTPHLKGRYRGMQVQLQHGCHICQMQHVHSCSPIYFASMPLHSAGASSSA